MAEKNEKNTANEKKTAPETAEGTEKAENVVGAADAPDEAEAEAKTEAKDKSAKMKADNKALAAEVEKLKTELAESSDKYLRMLAEYDNFRRRSQKEKEGVYAEAYGEALKEILPIEDNLERAVQYSEGEGLVKGVQMILKQFEDVLVKLGIESFGARGDAFDPMLHNAVMMMDDPELPENSVAEVLQKGYKKGDKIIRFAVVKVANS